MSNGVEKQEILLATGTNEVEIAEFVLCSQRFGVNVAKIREFIPFEGIEISEMPGRHPSVAGIFILRGKAIPLVDLDRHLNLQKKEEEATSPRVVVVTEFNGMTTAYVADHINRIHRISWTEFKPLDTVLMVKSSLVTGSVSLEGKEVLILDLEHIIGEIFPRSVINYNEDKFAGMEKPATRAEAKVVFAEDSAIIRQQVSKILKSVGYENLMVFENGRAALESIMGLKEQAEADGRDIGEYLTIILTDIEMPQMDGLTLCRRVKQDLGLDIPVIIFSSLINEQMKAKCISVGADGFCSKPETEKVIELLDEKGLS